MNGQNLNKVLLLIPILIGLAASIDNCDRSAKQGPFVLNKPRPLEVQVKSVPFRVTYILAPSSIESSLMERSYWQMYTMGKVFNSDIIRENTVPYPPDLTEANQWFTKASCAVGDEISIESGGYDECHRTIGKADLRNWIPGRVLKKKWEISTYYRGCFRYWSCANIKGNFWVRASVHKTYRYIHNVQDPKDLVQLTLVTPEYQELNLEFDKPSMMTVRPDTVLYSPGIKTSDVKMGQARAKCFPKTSGPMDCIIQCDCPLNGLIVTGEANIWFCERSECFLLIPDKVITKRDTREELNKASSLADINELSREVAFDRDTSHFNFAKIGQAIDDLNTAMHSIVESVSKIDEKLLGKVMNKSVITDWISPKVLYLYPCLNLDNEQDNCAAGLVYTHGRWVRSHNKDQSSYCQLLNTRPRGLDLNREEELFMPEVKHLVPRGTTSSQKTWIDMARQWAKDDGQKSEQIDKGDDQGSDGFEMFKGLANFLHIGTWFSGSLSVINSLLIALLYCMIFFRRAG